MQPTQTIHIEPINHLNQMQINDYFINIIVLCRGIYYGFISVYYESQIKIKHSKHLYHPNRYTNFNRIRTMKYFSLVTIAFNG